MTQLHILGVNPNLNWEICQASSSKQPNQLRGRETWII